MAIEMAEEARRQALREQKEARRAVEEAEAARVASVEYRRAEAKRLWEEALDAKKEREAALRDGLPLAAQEWQGVVLRGVHADLRRRADLMGELMPLRTLLHAQDLRVVESVSSGVPDGRTPPPSGLELLSILSRPKSSQVLHRYQPPTDLPDGNPTPSQLGRDLERRRTTLGLVRPPSRSTLRSRQGWDERHQLVHPVGGLKPARPPGPQSASDGALGRRPHSVM